MGNLNKEGPSSILECLGRVLDMLGDHADQVISDAPTTAGFLYEVEEFGHSQIKAWTKKEYS